MVVKYNVELPRKRVARGDNDKVIMEFYKSKNENMMVECVDEMEAKSMYTGFTAAIRRNNVAGIHLARRKTNIYLVKDGAAGRK
jgi:hypothetical protein